MNLEIELKIKITNYYKFIKVEYGFLKIFLKDNIIWAFSRINWKCILIKLSYS